MSISNILLLLGGVALFLFGMSIMGDGLKNVAGNKLELVLYKLSGTPLKGILLGTGVTAVIQSSSATSVMVVGFVNSGMMKVLQAIGVIMGAIIGTSVTGWVICLSELSGGTGVLALFSTEILSSVIAIIGVILKMASKKKTAKHVGDIMLGFAVLMFGMKTMSSAVSGLKENPEFIDLLTTFKNPIIGILVGIGATAILQSASASVGILQAISNTGAITFDIAMPIILGIAIGASVPVIMSSVGATIDGKRTAFSYPVIEVLRVLIFSLIFYGISIFIPYSFMNKTMDSVSIALVNTLFRALTIILLIPFMKNIENIVNYLVKPDPQLEKEMREINKLEERFLNYPPLAVEHSRMAINEMAKNTKKNYYEAIKLCDNYSDSEFDKVDKLEGLVDRYEDKIGKYLMKLTGRELTEQQTNEVGKYLHAITDLERISDHSLNIAESFQEIAEKKLKMNVDEDKEIRVLMNATSEVVSTMEKGLKSGDEEIAHRVEALEDLIDDLCDEVKLRHIDRLSKNESNLQNGYVINDLLTNFERIADHCSNIAVAIIIQQSDIAKHEYTKLAKEENNLQVAEFKKEYSGKYQI